MHIVMRVMSSYTQPYTTFFGLLLSGHSPLTFMGGFFFCIDYYISRPMFKLSGERLRGYSPRGGGGGGTRDINWWGCATPKKGGLRCGHSPKRGVLGAGTAQKKGGLRCGHNQKKGGLRHVYNSKKWEFRTALVNGEGVRN